MDLVAGLAGSWPRNRKGGRELCAALPVIATCPGEALQAAAERKECQQQLIANIKASKTPRHGVNSWMINAQTFRKQHIKGGVLGFEADFVQELQVERERRRQSEVRLGSLGLCDGSSGAKAALRQLTALQAERRAEARKSSCNAHARFGVRWPAGSLPPGPRLRFRQRIHGSGCCLGFLASLEKVTIVLVGLVFG